MQIFGFTIRKAAQIPAIVSTPTLDGALETMVGSGAAHYGYTFDFNKRHANEVELINKYRAMGQVAEIDSAIEEIINECVVVEEENLPVSLNIVADDNEIPPQVQNLIVQEFENILTLLDFNTLGHDMFRNWYVDGRYFAQIIADEQNLANGIQEIRQIDSRKIKKVREVRKEKNAGGIDVVTGFEEYFIFNDSGINSAQSGVKLSPDVIIHAPSGLLDENSNTISFLHKAIKPANMLRYMEDACLIYTLSRAPERRAFYIDVADIPKQKQEQYVKDVMTRYKNKIVFDSTTGELKDDRVHLSMLEDYWLPRRGNGKATEITTIQGSSIMMSMDNINYFKQKLAASLNLPFSRMQPDQAQFSLGRSNEISRDEVKFSKFIARLRKKFSSIFYQALKVQLVLKGIIAPEDWQFIRSRIQFDFLRDNYFSELKNNEVLMGRIQMLQAIEPYIGVFYSKEYVQKSILHQTTEEIIRMAQEMAGEVPEQTTEEEQQDDSNPKPKRSNPKANPGNKKRQSTGSKDDIQ